jgi:hypothetical protein
MTMSNHYDGQSERQYHIDRITAQYADEYRQGRHPRIEDYLKRYPQFASELLDFAVYYHTIGFDTEDIDGPAEATLSPAGEAAMARIREQSLAYAPTSPAVSEAPAAIEGLVKQGIKVGVNPLQLVAAVGIAPDILSKLEEHAIAAATIPRALFQRLAGTLKTTPEAIAAFLGAAQPGQSGAFYYAEQRPDQPQESFLDAVQKSPLPPDRKREWAEIAGNEASASE